MDYYLKRKERIVLTALDIINDLGFQGLSTKEICKREGISEGALYKHYQSKKDVILAVLDQYALYDSDIEETIENSEMSVSESISFFVMKFAEYYENYPAMTAIFASHNFLRYEEGLAEKNKEIYDSRFLIVKTIIDKGIKKGEVKSSDDSDCLTDIILGTCYTMLLTWRMSNYSFSLRERVASALNHIIKTSLC